MHHNNTFDELPKSWQWKVKHLRAECARYRLRCRELNQEVDALRTELEEARR
jgi:hypothetical protein